MDEKDPPPFGYTFDFFGAPSSNNFDNGGRSLLSDMESQQLDSFFSHTNPFGSETATSTFPFAAQDTSDLVGDFPSWSTVPPATIHNISTTIPDQSLLHGFHAEQHFAPPQPSSHFASTTDDLQAASTLYAHASVPPSLPAYQPNGRSYSFHGLTSAGLYTNGHETNGLHDNMPLVPATATSTNGLMPEQLAALPTTRNVDTSAAQFANSAARANHEADPRDRARPSLKRSYTYGTDASFQETGFQPSSKQESEELVTKRLIRELHHAQPLARPAAGGANGTVFQAPAKHIRLPTAADNSDSNEERASDESSADDDEDKRRKKRQKRPPPFKNGKRKNVSGAAAGKNRKASVDDRVNKLRRKSVPGQKPQRENLTEEQKRNNHILSEQKRRNLIKRGFDDLHDLVPEIRNGGLSKSGVLTEAANFLQQLIEDNERYSALLGAGG